jgi:hypothetical protein
MLMIRVFRNGDNCYAVIVDGVVVACCVETHDEAQEIARDWRETNARTNRISS